MTHPDWLLAIAYVCLAGPITCPDAVTTAGTVGPRSAVDATDVCEVVERGATLPDDVRETSGLARSARDPDLFWTHNDAGGDPVLFGIDAAGRLVARVSVSGASLVDWEDLEAAPCPAGTCLHIGDIGDNDGDRDSITVYRVPEPSRDDRATQPAEAFHARFPDGPRDAEALFVGPAGDLYVVTKGRSEEIGLYRWRLPAAAGTVLTLEHVRSLFPEPDDNDDRVTGATATPDGRWVGIRTYRTLYLYPLDPLVGGQTVDPLSFDLSPLGEPQGEAVVLTDDGHAWLSSEAGGDEAPSWSRLRCTLPSR